MQIFNLLIFLNEKNLNLRFILFKKVLHNLRLLCINKSQFRNIRTLVPEENKVYKRENIYNVFNKIIITNFRKISS